LATNPEYRAASTKTEKRLPRVAAVAMLALTLIFFGNMEAEVRGGPAEMWPGAVAMTGGKGYATSIMGQVHYRDIGPRDSRVTLLLLHMTPMSIMEFAAIQNALADLGIRSVAVDTPGYGMSDQPKHNPSIAEYADNLVPVLDSLKISKVVVGGHHTGADIAASFAVRHADRTSGVILHGLPMFTKEELDIRLDRPEWVDRTPKADGSHLSYIFRSGAPASPEILAARTWMAVLMFLQGRDVGHYAAYTYDLKPDFMAIKAPGLIITDTADAIHYLDVEGAKLRPDFTDKVLSEGNTGEIMIQPKKWAEIAADWMKSSVQ
jgi:pimeloyl-ACP methyl ester carboxylesterase